MMNLVTKTRILSSASKALESALENKQNFSDEQVRIQAALETIRNLGGFDGAHHKQFALDQVVRVLTGCPAIASEQGGYVYEELGESEEYKAWVKNYEDGEEGPQTYLWDIGTPP